MNSPDTIVNAIGILYGVSLVLAAFVRTPFTEALRIDTLFMKQADERTRPVNLIVGLLVACYGAYSLLAT